MENTAIKTVRISLPLKSGHIFDKLVSWILYFPTQRRETLILKSQTLDKKTSTCRLLS